MCLCIHPSPVYLVFISHGYDSYRKAYRPMHIFPLPIWMQAWFWSSQCSDIIYGTIPNFLHPLLTSIITFNESSAEPWRSSLWMRYGLKGHWNNWKACPTWRAALSLTSLHKKHSIALLFIYLFIYLFAHFFTSSGPLRAESGWPTLSTTNRTSLNVCHLPQKWMVFTGR